MITTVIIPSFDPDEKLILTVQSLIDAGFDDIIIVDDGSDKAHKPNIPDFAPCTILTHDVNMGKGAALKTAFRYFLENRSDMAGVVTVDGDGQHLISDIVKCVRAMEETPDTVILGARSFESDDIPLRSRFGNSVTAFMFGAVCGIKITDTQTGLRCIPSRYIPLMTEISGNRYEYETNMLLEMKAHSIPYSEVKITAVYEKGNPTSHFNPVRDSLKIYAVLLRFIMSSCVSALIDILVFYVLSALLTDVLNYYAVFVCTASARMISSAVNFWFNHRVVFNRGNKYSVFKYYALAAVQMALSAGTVYWLSVLFSTSLPSVTTALKIVTDTILFIISFQIQREWVFKK